MEILTHPNPVLKQHAMDVDIAHDSDLRALVRTMAGAMYEFSGVGLAAPQIGVAKRVIVFDVEDQLSALVNPVIVERADETVTDEEGCLSVPGISVPIARAEWVVCNGVTLEGKEVTLRADDFLARVLQHEIDHLDGVLILDRLDLPERKEAIKAYNAVNQSQRLG
ncbi:MAG: peptide deformylase [Coriobacteriia bacterium]|nr:peptide deformylase [Coriobacteriia bacterium]